jgi:hypothetical protein
VRVTVGVKLGRLIDAVRDIVPESMWDEIAARLNDREPVQPSWQPFVAGDDGDQGDVELFDPGDDGDDDDDF